MAEEEKVDPVAAAPVAAAAPVPVPVPEAEKFVSSVQPAEEAAAAAKEPAEAAEQFVPGVPVEPYTLEVPGDVPAHEQTPERMAMVTGFQEVAAKSGVSAQLAQQMLDAVVDITVAVPGAYLGACRNNAKRVHATSRPSHLRADFAGVRRQNARRTDPLWGSDPTFSSGHDFSDRLLDPDFRDSDDAMASMVTAYGLETAQDLVIRAQRHSKSLGPAMQKWLDGGAGNDVGVLTCLALGETGIFRLSSAQAADTIKTIMVSKDYNSPDPKKRLLQVARVQILSRIAHKDAQDVPEPVAKKQEPRVQTGASTTATIRSEVNRMLNDKAGPLANAGHPGHAAAVARWHELVAKL